MITLKDAKKIIEAAEKKAEKIGQPMNIGSGGRGRKFNCTCTHGWCMDWQH